MCYFCFGIICWSMICYCHDECIRFRYIWRNCIKRSRMHLPGIDSPSLHPVMHHCLLACCTVMHLLALPLPSSPPLCRVQWPCYICPSCRQLCTGYWAPPPSPPSAPPSQITPHPHLPHPSQRSPFSGQFISSAARDLCCIELQFRGQEFRI